MTNLPIPPDFAAFAREQVAAGRYASEAEVVADALRRYLADRDALLALLDPAHRAAGSGRGAARSMPRRLNGAAVSGAGTRAACRG